MGQSLREKLLLKGEHGLRGSAPPVTELEQDRVIGSPQGKSSFCRAVFVPLNTDLSLGELHACKLGRLS